MNKTQRSLKPESIIWRRFSRHSDAVFRSLGREIRIGVLSVATLLSAAPSCAAAIMSMSDEYGYNTGEAAATDDDGTLTLADLQDGDLLFCVENPQAGTLGAAITDVTQGYQSLSISHVAIMCRRQGLTYALEATGQKGVWLNPIDSFIRHAESRADGRSTVLVGRVNGNFSAKQSISNALSYLGKPYDDYYLPTDSAIYCSELVQLSYVDAQGKLVFNPQPMSFHDATGQVTDYWKAYYRKRHMEVPEGHPGSNPGGLSRNPRVRILGEIKVNK